MTIDEELEVIRENGGGVLRAEDVVEFAKNKKTALHSQFQWDDTEAARQYRVWQARQIIRVRVVYLDTTPKSIKVSVKAYDKDAHEGRAIAARKYVSLTPDRGEGGGYRAIDDIMDDEELRRIMLDDAKSDLKRARDKYRDLGELSEVWAAIDKAIVA